MAVCSLCGTILHYDDIKKHECEPSTVPEKGKVKKPTTTTTDIKITEGGQSGN